MVGIRIRIRMRVRIRVRVRVRVSGGRGETKSGGMRETNVRIGRKESSVRSLTNPSKIFEFMGWHIEKASDMKRGI